ncbi:MAG TPA: thioredoxin family protein [Paraburkholderia sp.]|nr:thioredoxin family protein [Paraburkholderia sp.]
MLSRFKTLTAVAALAAVGVLGVLTATPATSADESSATPTTIGAAPEFTGIDKWLNSDPLTMKQLRGKVVLVDFWTYTCINCVDTLPYVKNWNQKYRDQGLVVVGVHTPEYPFERDTDNVTKAIRKLGITYPVAQDNEYATWGAYNNQYWPAFYLIDKKGQVVYSHFGEGDYAQTEAKIQSLLAQKG